MVPWLFAKSPPTKKRPQVERKNGRWPHFFGSFGLGFLFAKMDCFIQNSRVWGMFGLPTFTIQKSTGLLGFWKNVSQIPLGCMGVLEVTLSLIGLIVFLQPFLVGGFKYFIFSTLLGEMIQFD